jgi:hypothetical protein
MLIATFFLSLLNSKQHFAPLAISELFIGRTRQMTITLPALALPFSIFKNFLKIKILK